MASGTQENVRLGRTILRKSPGSQGETFVVFVRLANDDPQTAGRFTAPFFIAHRPVEVVAVTERHETAGSDSGAVTVMLKKVPSATAPASGTDMLSAGINLKATANTNQSGSLSATLANRRLAEGDALSLVSTGTLTALVGLTVSVRLRHI